MSEKAWNIATEEAEIAEAAFIHLTDLYNMYQKQAAEHYEGGILESRRSKYKFELMKAEKKKSHWTSEVEECKQKKGALKEGEVKKALDQRLLEVKAAQEQEKARLEIEKKVTEERASIAEQARIERERKEEAAVKAKETLAEVAEQEEAAIQRAKEEAEQMIITKAREGEEAFSLARQLEENESVWETAKRVTLSISNYWNGIIKDLQAGRATLALNQEKATFQKEYWLEKSQVADLRLLSLKMLRSGCYEQDRADALISMVREKAWPIVSKTMKSFIEHPSEAKMLTVREFASALFSASTVSSPYTFIYPFSVDSVYISSYDSSVAFASAASNEAYTTLSNEAYAGTFAEAAASAAASAYAFALTSSSISAIASASTVTSVFAVASVYVSANAAASAAICAVSSSICAVVSASEALAATNLADNLADDIQFSVDLSKKIYKNFSEIQIENLEWAVNTTREIANYAHAVANYKAEQEALHRNSLCQPTESQGWEKRVNLTWAQANREKNETAWKLAGAAAREAMTKCQQVQGIPPQEILRQKAYWKERSDIAEFKALAMSFCANNWRARSKRIRDLMEMACKKFGSPISPTMKEFIAHPSEVTLRATGKSFVIPMTASEATAIVEKAEFFANLVAEGAALAKMNRWGVEDQERMNWLATITQEALEFARAVANFKNLQNS
ncbi:MAG TPA: hypothetical protein VJK54_04020 [Chthoniobacterales bacterium]|nr:hypothetical protein [Chthoniobacterales bacterium]